MKYYKSKKLTKLLNLIYKKKITAICDNHVLDGCPIIVNVKADKFKIQLIANEKFIVANQPYEICVSFKLNYKLEHF